MKWYKYDKDKFNILIESSDIQFQNLNSNELQIESDFKLPSSIQPLDLYCYNVDSLLIEPYYPKPFKIEELLDFSIVDRGVRSINYKSDLIKSLYPKREFTNGFLTKVIYYKVHNMGGSLSEPVIEVIISYILKNDAVHESGKTVEKRVTTRKWYHTDGSLCEFVIKETEKFYPHITESRAEGRKRRGNIFNITSKDIVILLMFTQTAGDQEAAEQLGLAVASAYESEFNNFTKVAGVQQLIDVITNDTVCFWLDNVVPENATVQFLVPKAIIGETIRDYINRSFSGTL